MIINLKQRFGNLSRNLRSELSWKYKVDVDQTHEEPHDLFQRVSDPS